jgi:2,3,4,5-tetrahydropyridine-2,6-dicarboxylate N-succinyltransferase
VRPDRGFVVNGCENMPGENLGSLAILAAAAADLLTVKEALPLFGEYYEAVLNTPGDADHANIWALLAIEDHDLHVGAVVNFNASGITPDDIEELWERRDSLGPDSHNDDHVLVNEVLGALDAGRARVAHKRGDEWTVNQWLKKAVLLSFRLNDNGLMEYGSAGVPAFDKVPLKFTGWEEKDFLQASIRVVPGAVVRRSAFIGKGVVLMPSFVNLGAYVGEGTMIDTWATVGSCAQIGKNCHISGGAGIGGVLEPLQANPVIVEDNCFIGARSEVVEGVIVGEGAVIGMGVFLGQSTPIYDRQTGETTYGHIPPYSVVVAGSLPRDGYSLNCAVIVKTVDAQTRSKTAINELLRD